MSEPEKYVLDTNVFIQAKRKFYPFDVCPGYWVALSHYYYENRVCSVDKIRDELESGGDDLWEWVRDTLGSGVFHDSSPTANVFGTMGTWVMS